MEMYGHPRLQFFERKTYRLVAGLRTKNDKKFYKINVKTFDISVDL